MANVDLMNINVRRSIIEEITSDENKARKAESLKRFEIYRERQEKYLVEKLEREFSRKTVSNMRRISSINLTKRITDEIASIYNQCPYRVFDEKLSDNEKEQIDNLYKYGKVDNRLKLANRYFKLFDQCALQVIPRKGIIQLKVLAPHNYDVVPDADDPEQPYAYVLSSVDKYDYFQNVVTDANLANPSSDARSFFNSDGINQQIGDPEDYKDQVMRYIVWTDDIHFVMDSKGNFISEVMPNPIGKMPFIDIADEKDMEFFVRKGNGIVDFSLDYSVLLSDIATINRLQGYSQAVISAEKQPTDMVVGPNHILFLQLDRNAPEISPNFQFVTPNPDMAASIDLLETTLRLFLTSRGVDPKTVSGKIEGTSFSSGIERLLSNIEKFEASSSDFELFKQIEYKLFEVMKSWSNVMQGVRGDGELIPDLQVATISPSTDIEEINFNRPEIIQTKAEQEDSVIKLVQEGLMSKSEAIMELRGVDEDSAKLIIDKIESEGIVINGGANLQKDQGSADIQP
jgi:hypothetical protein